MTANGRERTHLCLGDGEVSTQIRSHTVTGERRAHQYLSPAGALKAPFCVGGAVGRSGDSRYRQLMDPTAATTLDEWARLASESEVDSELPVVTGSFRQFGAHGWRELDRVRMRAGWTARSV